jgi:hypothetical protein
MSMAANVAFAAESTALYAIYEYKAVDPLLRCIVRLCQRASSFLQGFRTRSSGPSNGAFEPVHLFSLYIIPKSSTLYERAVGQTTNKRSKRAPEFRAPHLPVFLISVGAMLEVSEPKLNIHIAPSLFTKIV